ncbi:MAG: hypothetical protein WB699_12395 [Bacteroidota bacterium]
MKKFWTGFMNVSLVTVLFSLLFVARPVSAQGKSGGSHGWDHLKYSIFFTSGDVEHLLADPAQFKKTMDYFGPVKPVRVYLDGPGRDEKVDVPLLKEIAARFRALGIEADGAMVPTSPRGGPSVYNNAEDLASLKTRMQGLAQVFDRIILDDWLFTNGTDPKSVADRGTMTWAEYRTKLLLEQSKKYIIDPAKEVNPKVQVVIKFPNWYEGFGENGYDVYNEVRQFDKMAIGIETRVPETQHQHIPIYTGYIVQKWESSADPAKWVGSWLDNYDMPGESNDYNAQVWQSVFARTPEIILWCAGQLWPTNPSSDVYPDFVEQLPQFDRVAGLLKGEARGVPIYLPFGSVGEYNISGYFGMAGIPLDPVAKFPRESQNAIFCLNSMKDPNLAEEMLGRLKDGKDVFMTFELWKGLKDTEFKNAVSLLPYSGQVSGANFSLVQGYRETIIKADRPFTFPGVEATTWPETRNVTLSREDYDFSVLMRIPYLNGTIYILNMPSNSYDLLELPREVLNAIRQAFAKELGVVLNAPGHVGMYLFGEKQYVLYNMNTRSAQVSVRFDKAIQTTGWEELVRNKQLKANVDSTFSRFPGAPHFRGPVFGNVSLTLQPYEVTIVQAP